MTVLRSFLLLVEVLCSVLLISLILLQRSKSEGLGTAFGGGMGESLFGSRAGNVLTKMTVILGSVFLLNTLVLGILYTGGGTATRSPISRGLLEDTEPLATEADDQDAVLRDILRELEGMPAADQPDPDQPAADQSEVDVAPDRAVPPELELDEVEAQTAEGDPDVTAEAEPER